MIKEKNFVFLHTVTTHKRMVKEMSYYVWQSIGSSVSK